MKNPLCNLTSVSGALAGAANITWRIEISSLSKSKVVELRTGQTTVLETEMTGLPCVAVAPRNFRRLALIFASRQGITFKGRKPVCRVLTVDVHGGELFVQRHGEQVCLKVSMSPKGGLCCLCLMEFGECTSVYWCPRCESGFHSICLKGQQKCPVCKRVID